MKELLEDLLEKGFALIPLNEEEQSLIKKVKENQEAFFKEQTVVKEWFLDFADSYNGLGYKFISEKREFLYINNGEYLRLLRDNNVMEIGMSKTTDDLINFCQNISSQLLLLLEKENDEWENKLLKALTKDSNANNNLVRFNTDVFDSYDLTDDKKNLSYFFGFQFILNQYGEPMVICFFGNKVREIDPEQFVTFDKVTIRCKQLFPIRCYIGYIDEKAA